MKAKNVIKKNALIPTALIAGGAGFVGSHLAEALLAKGARVIVLDNFSTGKQSFVNHLLSNPNFALYDCDINEAIPADIASVDYVFHLAGLEEYSYAKEVLDLGALMTNAFGTKKLLDLAKQSEAKFLLLSTIDVYEGRMSQLELTDYFGKNRIEENKYMLAEAKRYAEALVWEYYKKHDIDVRIVRVPEIYGPRMNLFSSGNLGRLLSDLVAGRDLTIYGEGSEKEFYLYIDDAISGILKAMYEKKSVGNIFSLITPDPSTVLEIAYMIKGVADASVKVKFEEAQPEGYFKSNGSRIPDTYNLEDIHWESKMALRDGIIKTLASLNYSANVNSFKPAKLIEQKNKTSEVVSEYTPFSMESVDSLQGIKQEPNVISQKPDIFQAPAKGVNFVSQPTTFVDVIEQKKVSGSLPKLRLPTFNFKFRPVNLFTNVAIASAVLLAVLFIFITLPIINILVNLKVAAKSLVEMQTLATSLDLDGVRIHAKKSFDSLNKSRNALGTLSPVFKFVKQADKYKTYDHTLGTLIYFSKAIYASAKGAQPLDSLWDILRPDSQVSLDQNQLDMAKVQIDSARNSTQLALADFKYVDQSLLPQKYKSYYDALKNGLIGLDTYLTDGALVYSYLPTLVGSDSPKKYLILFQNSNELRATGGFVGSYGVLTLDKGKIKDLIIDDVYNPDGQIDQRNIVADIPAPLADFLKETKLHIRNANWNPDFSKSAAAIEDLYFKVTGEKVDGVIAIDLYFIKNLMKATGPIYLTAYNEEITADNLYERTEMHSEFNYENGSDQKKSFLTVLGSKLMERFFSLEKQKLSDVAKAFTDSLNEKHALIYLSNNSLSTLLKKYNWDGNLIQTDGDYLYIVDSNLGGTKANYYVKKSMNYSVSSMTRDGLLRGVVKIMYEHTGKDTAWPGGPYTDYLRVLTKNGAKLTGATLQLNDTPAQDIFKQVLTTVDGANTVFETSFIMQPQSKLQLTLMYDLAPSLSISKTLNDYKLYWQKQPGTQDENAEFSFYKPFGMKPVAMSANLNQQNDVINTHTLLNSDMSLYVKLQ